VQPSGRVDGAERALLIYGEPGRRVTRMLACGPGPHWLYVPHEGRLVYSLSPGPGLTEAGHVAGVAMTLHLRGRCLIVENAPPRLESHPVYARYDPDWRPANAADADRILLGELVAESPASGNRTTRVAPDIIGFPYVEWRTPGVYPVEEDHSVETTRILCRRGSSD